MARSTRKTAAIDKETGRAILEGDSSPVPAKPNRATKRATKQPEGISIPKTADPVFAKTVQFIRKFVALDDAQAIVAAMWVMGTWTFSPASPATPYTYPMLYITGQSGSGKSTLGQQVFGAICRHPEAIAGSTGPALFKLMGDWDKESGQIIPNFACLLVDEIDATYNGAKDESLRQMFNIGYRQGVTVPRTMPGSKTSIRFPVYGPKTLMGIDNGHLPETVTNRCIRIEMKMASPDEAAKLTPFFPWEVDDAAADLSDELAQWAKANAMVLRDYSPDQGPLSNRKWEISRSLVQLAKAAGVEKQVMAAIVDLFDRAKSKPPFKVALYRSIFNLIDETGATKLRRDDVLARLREDGVPVPDSFKLFSNILGEDGIPTDYVRIDKPGMFGYVEGKTKHRGYYAREFDEAFGKYLADEDDE